MKKLLFILLVLSSQSYGQKVVLNSSGNYVLSPKPKDSLTKQVLIDDKGVEYKVYLNSKNKPYIIRKSKKTGKEYKAYLKVEPAVKQD